jgi:predicted nucleic acid-binding protein
VAQLVADGHSLVTSRINEAEFRVGPELSREPAQELVRVERVLGGVVILEFDAQAALRYARIKAHLLRRGRPAGDCDMLIAAVAIANGQLLLTRNPKHFVDVPGLELSSY